MVYVPCILLACQVRVIGGDSDVCCVFVWRLLTPFVGWFCGEREKHTVCIYFSQFWALGGLYIWTIKGLRRLVPLTYNWVQFKTVSVCSEKPMWPRLSEVFAALPLKQCQCSSQWRRPSLFLSRKIVEHFLFQHPSPPGDQWWDAPGVVSAGSVSSSSTPQTLRDPAIITV